MDDDPSVCRMIAKLLIENNLQVQPYSSAEDFFQEFDADAPGCLVTELRMPGMTGIDVLERLTAGNSLIPTIVISGNLDVSTAVRVMKHRAVDVLEKPLQAQVFLDSVRTAIELDRACRKSATRSSEMHGRLDALSLREREVFRLVVEGHANKRIARLLQIAVKTVESHRGRVMRKLGARNIVELVRLGVPAPSEVEPSDARG